VLIRFAKHCARYSNPIVTAVVIINCPHTTIHAERLVSLTLQLFIVAVSVSFVWGGPLALRIAKRCSR
jgi:hypothetical protein